MEFGAGADIFEGSKEVPFSGVRMWALNEHRKLYLQMAKWAIEGDIPRVLAMIETSNRYNQSQIATGTLLERMVAMAEIRGNGGFLGDLLRQKPKTRISKDLVNSFEVPDTHAAMTGAMEHELRSFSNFIQNDRPSDFAVEEYDTFLDKAQSAIPYRWFLRRNETLNKYFEITNEELSRDCQSSSKEEASYCPSAEWLHKRGFYPDRWIAF